MKVIDVKGNYELIQYNNRFFAVDYSNENVGISLIFSRNEKSVRNRFNSINPDLTPRGNGYKI